MNYTKRLQDIKKFYFLLDQLDDIVGGIRTLKESNGIMDWPDRGVYFFFEHGEERSDSGDGKRVVRVGTHALKSGSSTTIWTRLRQHRGTLGGSQPGGGNQRGSIFRHHVGTSLIKRDDVPDNIAGQWEVGNNAPRSIREAEYPLEKAVSNHIGKMPFLWLEINDSSGPDSMRGYIERNSIGLLSNTSNDKPIDPASINWLGLYSKSEDIKTSGLWNVNHVNENYERNFLDILEKLIFSKLLKV